MSDSTQQYILSRPVRIEKWTRTNTNLLGDAYTTTDYEIRLKPSDPTQRHPDRFSFSQATYEEFFQLLDVPAIEKQLDDILRKLTSDSYIIGWANAKNEPGGQNLDECRERATTEVLALFGLENKENDNG